MDDRRLPLRSAIICLPGWTQTWGPDGSGLWALYDGLCAVYHDRRKDLVLLREWDSDAAATARLIAQRNPRYIIVVAYSYGAGFGLPQLASQLAKLPEPRRIHYSYLVDPVPRWRFAPAKLLSLTRIGDYQLPESVDNADYWRQLNDAPYGRAVVAHPDAPHQRIACRSVYGSAANLRRHAKRNERDHAVLRPSMGHSDIDDSPSIRAAILQSIDHAIGERA